MADWKIGKRGFDKQRFNTPHTRQREKDIQAGRNSNGVKAFRRVDAVRTSESLVKYK